MLIVDQMLKFASLVLTSEASPAKITLASNEHL